MSFASVDIAVRVSKEDFDVATLQGELQGPGTAVGAVVSFVGLVRDLGLTGAVDAIELEHYPGMTEHSIRDIIFQAAERWPLLAVRVVHRIGHLTAGDQIVYVGVSSLHRQDGFSACEFIMDYLKTQAPLWKKELRGSRGEWVDARDSDAAAAQRWAPPEGGA